MQTSYLVYTAKAVGIITLIVLAFIYRGGEDGKLTGFAPNGGAYLD